MIRGLALALVLSTTAALAQSVSPVSLYAAGSLRAAFTEAAAAFTDTHGVPVTATFGASGLLRERIEAGEPAEVFAPADFAHAARLAAAGRGGPAVIFARNRMCLMVRPGVPGDDPLVLMLDAALRLGTSTPGADPSGDYAWAVFARAEAMRPGARAVLTGKALMLTGGPSSPQPPAGRSAYAWHLAEDRADLFLGYCNTGREAAAQLPGTRLLDLPERLTVGADYGLAVLSSRVEASRLALFLLSPLGQAILARHGFTPVTAPQESPS